MCVFSFDLAASDSARSSLAWRAAPFCAKFAMLGPLERGDDGVFISEIAG